jgi:Flp pilus assembly pilin Flp
LKHPARKARRIPFTPYNPSVKPERDIEGIRREDGQAMAEYSVILTVLSIGVIAALGFLVAALSGKLDFVTTALGGVIH